MPIGLNQPLFSPDELVQNQQRKVELIETCASQESVLVGAGLGRRLGYPTWDELLGKLHDLVVSLASEKGKPFIKPPDWANNPLNYADLLRSHVQVCTNSLDRYHNFLSRTFDARGNDPLHKQLVELPFRGIITTNYDPSLDQALADKENDPTKAVDNHFVVDQDHARDVSEFILSLRLRRPSRRQIAHLHGRFNLPSGITLTESDYRRRYDSCFDASQKQELSELIQSRNISAAIEYVEKNLPEWTLHRKFLWTLLSSRSAVFVGFSMEDPYFKQMLRTVVKDLWRWDQPSHFAVMALATDDALAKGKAELLRSEYGVAVVFYENRDGRHAELESLVQEISSMCGVGRPQEASPKREVPEPPEKSSLDELKARLTNISERTRRRTGPP
jgi:hypothetical protein